jgi:phage terminase large subunit-like protein
MSEEIKVKKLVVKSIVPSQISPKELLIVKLDADGEEYEFAISLWELVNPNTGKLDINQLKSILDRWRNEIIPKRRLAKKLNDLEIYQFIRDIAGKEI